MQLAEYKKKKTFFSIYAEANFVEVQFLFTKTIKSVSNYKNILINLIY